MVELKVSSIGQVSDETFSVTLDEVAADGSVVRSITVEFPWDMKPAEVKALIIANYERKLAEETAEKEKKTRIAKRLSDLKSRYKGSTISW